MSATVNEKIFINYFPSSQFKFSMINAGEKPMFNVDEFFLDKSVNKFNQDGVLMNKDYIEKAVETVVNIMKSGEEGDILVFFSGKGDSQDGCTLLHQKVSAYNKNTNNKLYCDILHSGTSEEDTKIITNSSNYKTLNSGPYTRKVVFSTNVAESSITIPDLKFVVDTGLALIDNYYPEKNMKALEKRYVSKASHKQRLGRTGRTDTGKCYNIFTEEEYNKKFPDFSTAPILLEDVSDFVLKYFANCEFVSHVDLPFSYLNKKGGSSKNKNGPVSLQDFLSSFIEPPKEDAIQRILERIDLLGGMNIEGNKGYINDMGRGMAAFNTSPEIGRMLIAGYNYRCRDEMCELAALMNKSDFRIDSFIETRLKKQKSWSNNKLREEEKKHKAVMKKLQSSYGDHISLLKIYKAFKEKRYDHINRRTGKILKEKTGNAKEWCNKNFLKYKNLDSIRYESKEYQRRFGNIIRIARNSMKTPNKKLTSLFIKNEPEISNKLEDNILKAILKGFYINIMKKEGKNYINCLPPSKTSAQLDRNTMISRPGNHLIYSQLFSGGGRASYTFIAKIPVAAVNEIKKKYKDDFSNCFTKRSSVKYVRKHKSKMKKGKKKKYKKTWS